MEYFSQGFAKAWALLWCMDSATISAVKVTLSSTFVSLCIALLLGLPLGFLLGYCHFPGRRFLRLISDTLLAFPTVLIGLIVYAFITRRGPLGEFGLLFTVPGMVIGQAMLALPIITSWVAQSVENLDKRCRETLLTLGATNGQLVLMTIRELRYDVAMVCVTAFGRVVTEVGIATMLGGNIRYATRTMTTAIALETSQGEFGQGIALGFVLLLIAFFINILLVGIRRRGQV